MVIRVTSRKYNASRPPPWWEEVFRAPQLASRPSQSRRLAAPAMRCIAHKVKTAMVLMIHHTQA